MEHIFIKLLPLPIGTFDRRTLVGTTVNRKILINFKLKANK